MAGTAGKCSLSLYGHVSCCFLGETPTQPWSAEHKRAGTVAADQDAHLGRVEALTEQHDFTDLLHVWHHHCDRPEQRLEVVRQLSTASVARVLQVKARSSNLPTSRPGCSRYAACAVPVKAAGECQGPCCQQQSCEPGRLTMVMKMPARGSSLISRPSNWKRAKSFFRASWICFCREHASVNMSVVGC